MSGQPNRCTGESSQRGEPVPEPAAPQPGGPSPKSAVYYSCSSLDSPILPCDYSIYCFLLPNLLSQLLRPEADC